MSTALMERPAAVAEGFSRDQVELIKRTIAKGASDDELQLFMAQCQRTGLDPFDRQIYFIKRKQKDKVTGQWVEVGQTQTSIDGFRVVAERTGEMDGQDVAWCDDTGLWCDVWLKKVPPFAARVIAYRKGCSHGFPAVARFDEYCQTDRDGRPTGMWLKMSANQIAKCAEALALRKAFPKQLSGLYTREEMAQADNVPTPAYTVTAPPVAECMAPLSEVAAQVVTQHLAPGLIVCDSSGPPEKFEPAYEHLKKALGMESDHGADLPDGTVRIMRVDVRETKNKNLNKYVVVLSDGREVSTIKTQLGILAESLCQDGVPVTVDTKDTKWGTDLVDLHRYQPQAETPGRCDVCGRIPNECVCDTAF